jgi:CHAD domain-containing protein
MAYRFSSAGKPAAEFRRILAQQNHKSAALLADWERNPAKHIHRARQCFKRIRALLWLLKPRHEYVYQVENRAYRDLAKRLAYARDASAMVEATDRLAERIWEPGPRQSLLMLRKSLAAQAEAEQARAIAGMSDSVATVRAELPLLAARIEDLPIADLSSRELRKGAKFTFARARRDYRRLDLYSPPEAYHHWRKHLKYAFYQTGLMAERMPRWSRRYRDPLSELAELLGNAQDLEVLGTLLDSQPDDLGIDINWRRLRRLVVGVQRDLQMQAIAMGRQLFEGRRSARAPVLPMPTRMRSI